MDSLRACYARALLSARFEFARRELRNKPKQHAHAPQRSSTRYDNSYDYSHWKVVTEVARRRPGQ